MNEKTKVDENLFYKGVDKKGVDPGRLSLTHGSNAAPLLGAPPSETEAGSDGGASDAPNSNQPRYLFHSAASLLSMAKRHNVRSHLPSS